MIRNSNDKIKYNQEKPVLETLRKILLKHIMLRNVMLLTENMFTINIANIFHGKNYYIN